jgi:hypothetical protein
MQIMIPEEMQMDGPRFDQLARALAAGRDSRRALAGRAIGSLAGTLGLLSLDTAAAKDKDKGKGDVKSKGPACREEGHPCEGNQVCCEGLTCVTSGPGSAKRCASPSKGVVATTAYGVQVDCAYDDSADQTTCTCTGMAPGGAPAVRAIAVSAAAICADVVGGNATLAATGAVARAGFTSESGQASLTLVLAGQVITSGTATYWCTTDAGVVPATGPGLSRVQDDLSNSVGSIEVQVAACDIATPPDGFDWHGTCIRRAAGTAFALAAWDGATATPQATGTTTKEGRLSFSRLKPGTYQLTQTDANWCHAESDGVDAQGNIVVKAGQRVTVWIFDCVGAP